MTEQVGRLERWRPVLKCGFPLDSRTIVEQVFPNLGVAVPQIAQPSYTHGEFIRDLVRPQSRPRDCRSRKGAAGSTSRRGSPRNLPKLRIAGGATSETVAIESEDSAAVLRAIAKLGLNSHANINYVRHLKLMTGMTPRAGASAS